MLDDDNGDNHKKESMLRQINFPEEFNQNDMIKENYVFNAETPMITSEPAEQTMGKAARYDKSIDREQPMAMPN